MSGSQCPSCFDRSHRVLQPSSFTACCTPNDAKHVDVCADPCSPRHAVRVPLPLLPRPIPHTHRPLQPSASAHCCTAQQPRRCSWNVSGAVPSGPCQSRGHSGTSLHQVRTLIDAHLQPISRSTARQPEHCSWRVLWAILIGPCPVEEHSSTAQHQM